MSGIRRGETERARHWRLVLRECGRSGLSQAAFCRQHDIHPGTLAWWKRQLRQRESGTGRTSRPGATAARGWTDGAIQEPPASGRFIELRRPEWTPQAGYEIVLPSGRVIRVPDRFDPQTLTRLLAVVESC
jgi:hypothetical protein